MSEVKSNLPSLWDNSFMGFRTIVTVQLSVGTGEKIASESNSSVGLIDLSSEKTVQLKPGLYAVDRDDRLILMTPNKDFKVQRNESSELVVEIVVQAGASLAVIGAIKSRRPLLALVHNNAVNGNRLEDVVYGIFEKTMLASQGGHLDDCNHTQFEGVADVQLKLHDEPLIQTTCSLAVHAGADPAGRKTGLYYFHSDGRAYWLRPGVDYAWVYTSGGMMITILGECFVNFLDSEESMRFLFIQATGAGATASLLEIFEHTHRAMLGAELRDDFQAMEISSVATNESISRYVGKCIEGGHNVNAVLDIITKYVGYAFISGTVIRDHRCDYTISMDSHVIGEGRLKAFISLNLIPSFSSRKSSPTRNQLSGLRKFGEDMQRGLTTLINPEKQD